MARKFYTPISLTGLELTNFKIQNLPDNPSPYGAGHSYYNTVAKELRIYDGTNWVPVGGSIEYGTYSALPTAGNNGRVYATTDTQTLYLDYNNAWLQIGASGSATYVNSVNGTTNQISVDQTTGDVTVSLPSYIDVPNGELHLRKTEYWKDGDQYGIVTANPYTAGEFAIVAINNLALESNNGNVKIEPSTTLTIFNGNLTINGDGGIITTDVNSLHLTADNGTVTTDTSEFHTPKIELWNGGDTSGSRLGLILAHPSDGSLSVVASNQMVLESHSGDIYVNPSTNSTVFGGELYITTAAGEQTIGTYDGPLVLQADNGVITTRNQEIHTRKTEYWYGGDDTGYQRGIIAALSSGEFTVVATTGDLGLESNSGDVVIAADGTVRVDTPNGISYRDSSQTEYLQIYRSYTGTARITAADDLALRAINDIILYPGNDAGGHTGKAYIHWGDDAANAYPQREIATVGTSQTFTNKTLGSGVILDADLNAEGYTISNLATPLNPGDAATKGYVDSTAQGLSVLGSVRTATSTNIDITANASDPISGVTLVNGDRVLVKAQTTATENGIYIYNSGSQTLVASTTPSDTDIKEGSYVLVEEGTYAAQGWIVTAFTAGASTWTQFSAAGEYTAGNGINISSGVISGVAKENGGLSLDGDGFAALLGTGLQINNGTGAIEIIDYSYITKKMAQTIGDADNTSFDIYHNFGTTDVSVTIYDTDSGEEVFADVTHATTSKVNVTFAVAPGTNQFRVVVIG